MHLSTRGRRSVYLPPSTRTQHIHGRWGLLIFKFCILTPLTRNCTMRKSYKKYSLIHHRKLHCKFSKILFKIFSVGCGSTFPTYLGTKPLLGKFTRSNFQPVVDKFEQRLAGWKSRLLNKPKRIILINLVLPALPTYVMSTVLMPVGILCELDTKRRNFFWNQEPGRNKVHCIN